MTRKIIVGFLIALIGLLVIGPLPSPVYAADWEYEWFGEQGIPSGFDAQHVPDDCWEDGWGSVLNQTTSSGTPFSLEDIDYIKGHGDTFLMLHVELTDDVTEVRALYDGDARSGNEPHDPLVWSGFTWVGILFCDGEDFADGFTQTSGGHTTHLDETTTESVTDIYMFIAGCSTDLGCGIGGGYNDMGLMSHVFLSGTADDDPFLNLRNTPYKPVRSSDRLKETQSGDVSVLATTAGARIFAVDDAYVSAVSHNADGYTVGLLLHGLFPVSYTGLSATFVTQGDTVDGGCVLGYAGPTAPDAPVGSGSLVYAHNPDLDDWHDYAESLSTGPCNQDVANCINVNPEMDDNGLGWLSRYAIADTVTGGNDTSMLVPKNGEIYQPHPGLDTDETYFVTLVVGTWGPQTTASVTIYVAGVTQTLPINTFGNEFVTVTTTGITPAFSGPSEFLIDNNYSGNTTLTITFACLHTGEALVAPPTCYFDDNGFLADSFETEGGATHQAGLLGIGQYSIPAGGVIRAPVTLSAFTDADTDFTLKIFAAQTDGPGELTASIVDSDTDEELSPIGTYDITTLFYAYVSRTFTIDAADSVAGDLYIENTGDETVTVESLCLSSDAGVFPGYEDADHTPFDLLNPICVECAFPETFTDVVAWLAWIGCQLRYLLYCLLYTLVNNVWGTIMAVATGVGLFGTWLGRSLVIIARWLLLVGGRLLASLLSTAIPIINAILAWIVTLPFVQSLLDSLAIVGIWVDGIFTLINNVLSLLGRTIQFIFVLFNTFGIAWSAFFDALSASPAVTVVLPDCTDSGTPFYDACLVFDVLNFVLAAVPAMGLLGAALVVKISWNRMRKAFKGLEEIFSI